MRKAIVFIILIELVWNGWHWIGEKFWYIGIAFSFVYLLYFLFKKSAGKERIVWETAFLLAVTNLIDELFFDATSIGINDYVFLTGIIIYTYKKLKSHKITNDRSKG